MNTKGLTKKILELHALGMTVARIAGAAGCTSANVSGTIRRHLGWSGYVSPLTEEHRRWIVREADRCNVEPALMARALLSDAIEEEMEKEAAR